MSKIIPKRAVVIVDQGFEDTEAIYSIMRLNEEKFSIDIATNGKTMVVGKLKFPLEPLVRYFGKLVDANELKVADYDVAILTGGYEAPDKIRQLPKVLKFLQAMHAQKKIVAAVCHGPWVLISAGLTKGRKMTCYKGMKDDLINSGAIYLDQAVVVDGNIITSRHPTDMGIFMKTIIKKVGKN